MYPLRSAALLLLLIAFGGPVAAQSRWTGTAHLGYVTGLDAGSWANGSLGGLVGVYRRLGRLTSAGIEASYQRHDVWDRVVNDLCWDPAGGTTLPPCTGALEPARLEERVADAAWHVGGAFRVGRPRGTVRPYGVVGLGLYGMRQYREDVVVVESEDRELAFVRAETILAPGATGGAGVDVFPWSERVGLTVGARFHLAGRPYDDTITGIGIVNFHAGVTLR